MFTERWRSLFMHTLSKKLYSIFYNRKYIVGFTQLQNNFRQSFQGQGKVESHENEANNFALPILIFGLEIIGN